mgnify:FL=1
MRPNAQEMVNLALSQRDECRYWHGMEMDACERMPAGSQVEMWHSGLACPAETWRGC